KLRRFVAKLRQRRSATSRGDARKQRHVSVRELSLTMRDRSGHLLLLQGGNLSSNGKHFSGAFDRAEIKSAADESVAFLNVHVRRLLSTPEAQIRAGRVEARTREKDTLQAVLRGFDATVARVHPRGFRTSGSGKPKEGGMLYWNLFLDSSPRRIWGTVRIHRLPFALLLPLLPNLPWYGAEKTELNGDLEIRAESQDELRFGGSLAITDGALF